MSFGLAEKLIAVPPQAPRIRGQGLVRFVARLVIRCGRWRMSGEFPDLPRVVVIVAPHSSNWDGLFGISFAYALGVRATWMGKDSLFRHGLGRLMRGLGGIPTDRSNPRGAVGQMAEMLRSARAPMWLFLAPEGTRKVVRKWRTGFWHIASEAQVPLLLAAIDFPNRRFVVGPLFATSGDKQADLERLYDHYRQFSGKHGKSPLPLEALER
ncbi:MAG: 1-acyl-sn-glycerol-3-phosphate acyltransferase [Xanthomonadales bacterium]|nr:hypothetical protein [Xanthomonadales bacterium]MCC6591706.1 1-acyl-sn-glycerol-3-phosphate acyltransferase [Xanthomonadales bacterium]MCE7931261.1 acyltransferase [Xanthomonadales bacterium PRO6]